MQAARATNAPTAVRPNPELSLAAPTSAVYGGQFGRAADHGGGEDARANVVADPLHAREQRLQPGRRLVDLDPARGEPIEHAAEPARRVDGHLRQLHPDLIQAPGQNTR